MESVLLSYYKDMNLLNDWSQRHASSAKDVMLYAFKGTNGRSLSSIIDVFKMMEEVEGKDRRDWPVLESTGQEKHKQYTMRMLETKLYYRDTEGRFYKTKKGELYKDFITRNFDKSDQWAINYIFLLDSYFEETESYLINRSKDIFDLLGKSLPENYINDAIEEFMSNYNKIQSFTELAEHDLFFLLSFYDDEEFLKKYFEASEVDREQLRNYILDNYNKQAYSSCCLSRKFKPGGVYNISEFKDDVLILAISLDVYNGSRYDNYYFALSGTLGIIKKYLTTFSTTIVNNYLKDQEEVIEPILLNVCGIETTNEDPEGEEEKQLVDINDVTPEDGDEFDKPEKKVDDTTKTGRRYLDTVFNYRKNIARRMSNYTCELEQYKGCRYFTSKKTNHNYVEVHHFVPREFRNNYEYSIDVFANYITLCPHCHKMIHLATDRERIDAIRYIYNKRVKRLSDCGLHVELEDLMKYYHITNA